MGGPREELIAQTYGVARFDRLATSDLLSFVQAGSVDRQGGAIGDDLEEIEVRLYKSAVTPRADHEHAEDSAFYSQWRADD